MVFATQSDSANLFRDVAFLVALRMQTRPSLIRYAEMTSFASLAPDVRSACASPPTTGRVSCGGRTSKGLLVLTLAGLEADPDSPVGRLQTERSGLIPSGSS